MKKDEIQTATREELADELGAAGAYSGDWETAELDDLRNRVKCVVQLRDEVLGKKW